MATTRVRASQSHSSLSRRRCLFQLHTSKSSTCLPVKLGRDHCLSDIISPRTFQFNIPPLPKRIISKELISIDAFLKKKPSSIIRRMLSFDGDEYRANVENIAIESESDDSDGATVVAGFHLPPFLKELQHHEALAEETNVEQAPSVMLGKKIYDYLPVCSDDEDDGTWESDSHDEPTAKAASSAIKTPCPSPPLCPINFWSPRNEIFDAPGFEIVNEDDRIVYATALSPPPWHRPKESMLVYEPASPDDEIQYPSIGEAARLFPW